VIVGAGGAARWFEAEKRGGSGRRLGEIELTSGPGLSAGERERGKGEWPAGWLGHGPRRGRGHRGFWAKRPKERKGEEKSFFVFIFPNKIFKLFSK